MKTGRVRGEASDNSIDFIRLGKAVVETEKQAIADLLGRIDDDFARACQVLLNCSGRIVVTGMGKSGHIGGKIAATLASTGSPAFFVHPGEASHGDLGMITETDVVMALSYSGETQELITILPLLKRLAVPLLALTGNANSTLAREATVHIDISVAQEACPLGLAPTSSSTATLVMGDALAVALLEARGFTAEDFARSHPGGSLGRRLLLHVNDIMHKGEAIPVISETSALLDGLMEMSKKGLGMTAVVDEQSRLAGIFTDGDLRRALDAGVDLRSCIMKDVMIQNCLTTRPEVLAAEALHTMESKKINGFIVVDENQRVVGAFNMHDLLRSGVV